MRVIVRPAEDEEAPLVHSIMQKAYDEYRGLLRPASSAHSETVQEVRQAMGRGGGVLAFLQGNAVGSARFVLEDGYMYIGRLSVLPDYRRRGVGRAMMEWLEGQARSRGYREVRLGVRLALMNNWRLYSSLGYRVVTLQPKPGGEDVVAMMVKHLEPPAEGLSDGWLPDLVGRLVQEATSTCGW